MREIPTAADPAASDPAEAEPHAAADALRAVLTLAETVLRNDAPDEWRSALQGIVRRARAALHPAEPSADAAQVAGDGSPADAEPSAGGAHPDEVEHFDAARLVESVAEVMAPRLGDRPVELVSLIGEDVPRRVTGTPSAVRRILGELLDNALRFTDTGAVTVECGWSDGLLLRVNDTGPGIPPMEQGRLFEAVPHVPQGGIWRDRAGEGMGLALSRSLAQAMGGRISFRSRLGVGSTFVVQLPLAAADSGERPLPDRIEGRVLLVEDDDRLRAGLARTLEDLGFLVDEARDGRSALRIARRASGYDLALLDAELDDAPGAALADLIGDRPSLRGVPRIAMTRSQRTEGLQVRKPVTRWRLERAVERALGRRLNRRTAGDEGSSTAGRRRVLVVDDNPDSRQLAARILESRHYRVDLADDGVQAVEAAALTVYDLILMDIEMPRLGGLEATERIRLAERDGYRVPIVAVTAHDDAGFRSRCIEAGMDDHVPRPVRAERLLRVVERALGVVADELPVERPTGPAPDDPLAGVLPAVSLDEDLLDLLPDFVEHRRADVKALRGWLDGQPEDARGVAHGLKGVGGAFGFPAITALGAMLGDAVRAGDRGRAARCVDRLDEHIEQIGRALAAAGITGGRS